MSFFGGGRGTGGKDGDGVASSLSDYEASISPASQYKPYLIYVPPGERPLFAKLSLLSVNKHGLAIYVKDTRTHLSLFACNLGAGLM